MFNTEDATKKKMLQTKTKMINYEIQQKRYVIMCNKYIHEEKKNENNFDIDLIKSLSK